MSVASDLDADALVRRGVRHSYRVAWSEDDGEFVGTCDQFPSMSCLASTDEQAFIGIRRLVADVWNERLNASQSAELWMPIATAPRDGTAVLVYVAEREGLSAFQCVCAWHEDAGWCADELRPVTHWRPLPGPPPAPEPRP